MNRSIIYDEEQVDPFDILWAFKDMATSIGAIEIALAGLSTTMAFGFGAAPTGPASLTINLATGGIFQQAPIDPTAYGALPTDTTVIQAQGLAPAQAVALSTSGLSAGQSMWALVQASFSQTDIVRVGDPTSGVLNYWNSANPTQPFQGPNNDGSPQPTERQASVSIQVIYGTPATTGSEVPPNPTSGWVPLYLIDLAFGQTAITSGQIKVAGPSAGGNVPGNYPQAPFLAGLLNSHHGGIAGQAPKILMSELAGASSANTGGGVSTVYNYAGNPNGFVAGKAAVSGVSPPDFCIDTTDGILYFCSVTGNAAAAVWSQSSGQAVNFVGGTSTGSANAQVVSPVSPGGFALISGYSVTFTPGFTNTGATTLAVGGTAATACRKVSGGSLVAFSGSEFIAATPVNLTYNGTFWVLNSGILGALAFLNIGTWLQNVAGSLTINAGLTLGDNGAGQLTVQAATVTPAMLDASASRQRAYVQPFNQTGGNLTIANDATNPNFEVDIEPGRVSDDSDATLIQIQTAIVKRLDQSWAAGTGNGACDTSTKGNSQTWHCFAIGKTGMAITNIARTSNVASLTVAAHNLGVGSTVRVLGVGQGFDGLQTITAVTTNTFNYSNAGSNVSSGAAAATALASGFDVLFSQSYASPTLPSGYNVKQCLGSVLTNSSGNIILFVQWGDLFMWNAPPEDISSGASGNYALSVPNGVSVEAIFNVAITMNANSAANLFVYQPGTTAPAVATVTNEAPTTGGTLTACNGRCITNASKQVSLTQNSVVNATLSTLGWRDFRRRLF